MKLARSIYRGLAALYYITFFLIDSHGTAWDLDEYRRLVMRSLIENDFVSSGHCTVIWEDVELLLFLIMTHISSRFIYLLVCTEEKKKLQKEKCLQIIVRGDSMNYFY